MKPINECRILVTPTSYGKYDASLKSNLESRVKEVIYNQTGKPLSSTQISELIPGIDGYIAGLDLIDETALKNADKLKIIARYGVGYDRVDLAAAKQRGIIVTNTPGVNSHSVAELTIGFLISLARQIPSGNEEVHKGNWPRLHGYSLYGKKIGIVGFGSIGQLVVKMLQPYSCKVLVYDPNVTSELIESLGAIPADLIRIREEVDFLSLHLPLTPSTKNLINQDFLLGMKKGACIINTSRGGIVKEDDLYFALRDGHIKGAALDVFETEPPEINKPIISLPQVILTPHIGANTDDAANRMGYLAVDDCLRVLSGNPPIFRVI